MARLGARQAGGDKLRNVVATVCSIPEGGGGEDTLGMVEGRGRRGRRHTLPSIILEWTTKETRLACRPSALYSGSDDNHLRPSREFNMLENSSSTFGCYIRVLNKYYYHKEMKFNSLKEILDNA